MQLVLVEKILHFCAFMLWVARSLSAVQLKLMIFEYSFLLLCKYSMRFAVCNIDTVCASIPSVYIIGSFVTFLPIRISRSRLEN